MLIQHILFIISFLAIPSVAIRGLAAQIEYDRTIRRNARIIPNIITDSPETFNLHEYLYKTLFLQDRFSIGQTKNFEYVPEIVFRMNDYIYQAHRESSFYIFTNNVEKYVNLTIGIGRSEDSAPKDKTDRVYDAQFRYFLEGSYRCSPTQPEINATICEPYQYFLQGIRGSLITLPDTQK